MHRASVFMMLYQYKYRFLVFPKPNSGYHGHFEQVWAEPPYLFMTQHTHPPDNRKFILKA